MKAVIQRTDGASVQVDGETVGKIGLGFTILLGVENGDTYEDAEILAQKVANLRVFSDSEGKMNLSLLAVNGEALVISNFTLCADHKKGNRPSFIGAADPETANTLYELFIAELKLAGVKNVQKGVFGGDMRVSILNDGPVTLLLDTKVWIKK